MNRCKAWCCVLAFVLAGLSAGAQQITGSLRGTVFDPSGAVVRGASVTVQQSETGLSRSVTTNLEGNYVFLELPVGHYRVEAAAKGFQKYSQAGIALSVNETLIIPLHLVIGPETEEIQVTAGAQLIQGTITALGKTVLEGELLDLPLDGRNFSQLGLLQPGVVPLTAGLKEAGGSLRSGQAYAVNGQRPESNNFLIDGANNVNAVDAGFVLKPPIDAISEFRILTHNANAEFGQNAGSTTNIITRSGSNSFHGTVWEFLRNDAMDAADFSAHAVQPLKQNQFGGTFGGPIIKDKTFFFGYYEGFRNRKGETVSATVPSLLQRQGIFPQPLFNFSSGMPVLVPGGQLTSIDPIASNILKFYPLPNRGTNTFVTTQSLSVDNDQFGLRFDHYLSHQDNLTFRYMYSSGPTTDPLSPAGANVPGFPVGEYDRSQNLLAQETHIFSTNVIAVARFSYLRNQFLFQQHINHQPPSDLGFQYQPTLAVAAGPPLIQIAGYATVGDPITGPRNTHQNTFDSSGDLSWLLGRHEMKFGGGFQRDQINALFGIASNGFFVFAPFPYSDAFASFLSGQAVFFLQGGGNTSRYIRGKAWHFYGQDTYKLTSRFTLNLGLRYELPFPNTELHNQQNLFVPGAQSRVLPNAPAGLLYPGDPGVPPGLIPTQKTALAPRVGLAFDPTGRATWLISAAYGIFYEPYYTGQGGPLDDPISAPPFIQTPQRNFPNFANPFNGANPFGPAFSEPMTLLVLSPKLRLPYAQHWHLTIQKSFAKDWLLETAYVGTAGVKLPRFIEGNPAIYVPGQSTPVNVDQRRLFSGCTLTNPNSCIYGSVGEIAGIANSSYNALESSLRKRFSHGLSFLASYTFSKAIDDVSTFSIAQSASQPVAGENDLAQNPFDLAAERGRSMFDARHRMVLSYQWSVPFWSHPQRWYEHVLGNWQLNGIVTLMSGTPFTVFNSHDVSLQGTAPEISGFSSNRPNVISDPFRPGPVAANPDPACLATVSQGGKAADRTRVSGSWFNPCAFAEPATGSFGNEGRNALQGPGFANWDFSAFKNIHIGGKREFQFRAEFFNFLNHTNLRLPETDIQSRNLGQIHSDIGPRVTQLALKFLF